MEKSSNKYKYLSLKIKQNEKTYIRMSPDTYTCIYIYKTIYVYIYTKQMIDTINMERAFTNQ